MKLWMQCSVGCAAVIAGSAYAQIAAPATAAGALPPPEIAVRSGGSGYSLPAPNAKWYATFDSGTLKIFSTENSFQYRSIETAAKSMLNARTFCISSDSERFLLPLPSKETSKLMIGRIEVRTGKSLESVQFDGLSAQDFACHPTEPVFAFLDGANLRVVNELTREVLFATRLPQAPGEAGELDRAMFFTPDGTGLIYVSFHGAHRWDWRAKREVWKLDPHAVHSANLGRKIDTVDMTTGRNAKMTAESQRFYEFMGAAISQDGQTLALAHHDEVSVVSAATGKKLDQIPMLEDPPEGVIFRDNTHLIVSAFRGPKIDDLSTKMVTPAKVFDIDRGVAIPGTDLLLMQTSLKTWVWRSADNEWLSSSADGNGMGWEERQQPDKGKVFGGKGQRAPAEWDFATQQEEATTSADGKWLAYYGNEGGNEIRLHVLDRELGKDKTSFQVGVHLDGQDAMAFSRDGRWLAVVVGGRRHVMLWSVPEFAAVPLPSAVLPADLLDSHLGFSEDGTMLAVTANNEVRVYSLPDGANAAAHAPWLLKTIAIHQEKVPLMLHLEKWETSNHVQMGGDRVSLTPMDVSGLQRVAFSPDGKRLAVSGGWFGHIFDTGTWAEQSTVPDMGWDVNFTPDSRYLVTTTFREAGYKHLDDPSLQTLTLWDLDKKEAVWRQPELPVDGDVRLSPDGKLVSMRTRDGMGLFAIEDGSLQATLYRFANQGWLVVTPQGLFDGTEGAWEHLSWRFGGDTFDVQPLEIYFRQFFAPGLLRQVMNHVALPGVRSIAEIKNRVQPEVNVISVMPSAKMAGRVDVVVHAASHVDGNKHASGLQDLRLFRDGQMVADGYREGTLKDGDYTFYDVMLKSGAKKVSFTAYAFNSERIKSATATMDYEPKPTAVAGAVMAHAYLVQIGVNHYAAEACELQYSANDANRMSAALSARMKAKGLAVEPVVLTSLAGGDASGAAKAKIRAELAAIAAKATPDDVFFMSFSGHGYSAKDGQFYILPSDVNGSCHGVTDEMLASSISADELAEWLRPIDAGEMTFVLDACHSAESVEANDFKPGPMGSRGLGQLAYDKRMRILAASQSDETAGEFASLQQGLLSYVLTHDGLEQSKADWKPKDGKITVGEWLSYAANAVPQFQTDAAARAGKGIGVERKKASTKPAQVPAVFDFSKQDTFALQ